MINRLKRWFDLKKVYIIVFLTLAFWTIFAYCTMNQLIKSQEVYAKLINISGKQRMLSQKTTLISKRYFESNDIELKEHLRSLIELMKKDHNYLIAHIPSNKIQKVYYSKNHQLDNRVNEYFKLLDNFYKNKDIDTLKAIENYSFKLLFELDYAVNLFEQESNEKTTQLQNRELFILTGTLITLILEALLIVIPTIQLAKDKEYQLIELNKSLEQKVRDEIDKVRKKDQILLHQAKMASLGEMLENIAHQWRQPLSVITTSATGVKFKHEQKMLEVDELFDFLDKIVNSANFLSETIENFRSFFNDDQELQSFEIEDVYKKSLMLLESKFKNREIKLVDDIEDIKVIAYENRLIQVFLNILSNAKDALESVPAEERFVFIKIFKASKGKVAIEIYDSAGGINKNIIDKIFEPYFTTKHKSQGTGIGLYMSREIITRHMKGEIKVENYSFKYNGNKYTGAKFSICIPKKLKKKENS